jgi:hypothetical protein
LRDAYSGLWPAELVLKMGIFSRWYGARKNYGKLWLAYNWSFFEQALTHAHGISAW